MANHDVVFAFETPAALAILLKKMLVFGGMVDADEKPEYDKAPFPGAVWLASGVWLYIHSEDTLYGDTTIAPAVYAMNAKPINQVREARMTITRSHESNMRHVVFTNYR